MSWDSFVIHADRSTGEHAAEDLLLPPEYLEEPQSGARLIRRPTIPSLELAS